MKEKSRLVKVVEQEENAQWEQEMLDSSYLKATVDEERRVRERAAKRRRVEERKQEEIPLVEFIRQVVDLTFKKHASEPKKVVTSQSEATAMLTSTTLAVVRYDSGRHLVRITERRGVCKECNGRTFYRCCRCDVALHPDSCFYNFHVPEGERE